MKAGAKAAFTAAAPAFYYIFEKLAGLCYNLVKF